jgi:hypothetical protein
MRRASAAASPADPATSFAAPARSVVALPVGSLAQQKNRQALPSPDSPASPLPTRLIWTGSVQWLALYELKTAAALFARVSGAWADGTNDAIVPVPSQGAGGLVEKGN